MIPINPSGSSFDANETLGAGRDPHDSETTHPVDEAEHPVHPDEAGLLAQALPPVPGPKYEQVIVCWSSATLSPAARRLSCPLSGRCSCSLG